MTSLQDFIDRDALISENERLVKQLEQLQTKESRRLEMRIAQEREDAQRRLQVRELKRLLSAEAIKQDMLSMIAQHAPLLTPPPLYVYEGSSARPEHTWVLVFSDLQYGQKTTLEASGMVFEQSSAVAKAQFSLLRDKLELLLQLEYATKNVKELVVLDLGDNHEGDSLRVSQATKVDAPVTVQCIETTDLITEFVTWALTRFPKVRYLKVGGNHDRISQKPGTAGLGELSMIDTFAWLQGEFLRRLFGRSIEDGRLSLTNHESWFGAAHIAGQRFVYEHGACLDDSSEMLTAEGWKRHEQLTDGELVACWDDKTGLLSWKPLMGVSRYEHDGPMIQIKQRGMDQLLTPNHRAYTRYQMYPKSGKSHGMVKRADELRARDSLPLSARWESYGSYGTYDDGLRLGLFLSEGWLSQGPRGKPRIHLAQSVRKNPAVCDEIRRVFSDCNISDSVRTSGFTGQLESMIEVYVPVAQRDFFDHWAPNKVPNTALLTEWSQQALEGLRVGMLMGDGDSRTQSNFTQKDGPIANLFSAVCVRLGYRVTGQNHGQDGITRTKVYGLRGGGGYGKASQVTQWTARIRKNPETIHYTGTVWCPEVPTGAFVARRNGNSFITGNSFRSSTGSYGGVSYYSIANAAGGYMRMLDGADMVVFGHFHQPMVLPIKGGWGWQVVNGAFPPSTEFVQSNFKGFGRPCQLLLDFHDDYGMVGSRPIYLETENMIKPGEFWAKVKEREDAA